MIKTQNKHYCRPFCVGTSSHKVLTAPIFLNLRNFGTKRDTTKKAKIESMDLLKIWRFNFVLF